MAPRRGLGERVAHIPLRKSALQLLQKITVEFVRYVSRDVRKLPQNAVDAAGGKIFTYGSYRLGVYGPGTIKSLIWMRESYHDCRL